ncbi:MAG: hypothetical protein Q7S01_01225 [bacterium]|nr:hypothetical protein [bacterium]
MSKENGEGGNVVNLKRRLEQLKATRSLRPTADAQQQETIPPLTDKEVLQKAREIVERFPGIASLAKDLDSQEIALGRIPSERNVELARAGYEEELGRARERAEVNVRNKPESPLQNRLQEDVRIMFAGYEWTQPVFFNTKYAAYARAYLEKFDPKFKLPDFTDI